MKSATTLRQRLALLDPEFAAQEHIRAQYQQELELVAVASHTIQRATALQQAKRSLGIANKVAQASSKLGGALKAIAMADINSLRSLKRTAKVASIMGEYSNVGSWYGESI